MKGVFSFRRKDPLAGDQRRSRPPGEGHSAALPGRRLHGLDYTNPAAAVNFRDVGEFVNLARERVWPEGHVFRGGTIKSIRSPAVIGHPRTIFNLQKGPDPATPGIRNVHFPISNDHEKYQTADPEVRKWLRQVVRTVEDGVEYPLYVHCLSGRDRTGVVVAAFLTICGVDASHIIDEYHLSVGANSTKHIEIALEGLADVSSYFKGLDLAKVAASLTTRPPARAPRPSLDPER